ncbi:DUF1127 domain-containing protein [Mesorhizobium sp. CU2]|uniref:DUF1127 domain-containing protein n=1 Tax=unclassified Mesorhizobium TaxID=325217 RepID=UPI001129286A|nr:MULTISPECIES: DUF1127 domain-containing protein [unclassified Mesorhizobium]TPN89689.1 DUF1127 domain-containing protein [Mesorhizobium sp. CU3]TPO21413.1 DUF1127 domain-containing protein [Mesorhizobium sp. CU2]
MTILEQELVADRSALGRFFAVAIEICRHGIGSIARILRIRRDRARLDEFPDHLLRDIGIGRGEIRSITRFGRGGHGDA